MLSLAFDSGRPAEARRWYAAAAERGSCHAVRMLNDPMLNEGVGPGERRRWQEQDRRRRCSVERWEAKADGSLHYTQPDDALWRLRIACSGHRIEVDGPAGLTPSEMPTMIVHTSQGARERPIVQMRRSFATMAFTVELDDPMLSALLGAERVKFEFPGGEPWIVDGAGASAQLEPLLARCAEGG
jgi:hypothetical protein